MIPGQQNKCVGCNYPLYAASNQFYCCNRNQRYCILCRGKACIHCKKPVEKRYEQPKCRICYTRAEDDQLLEPLCQSYYCSRCLATRIIKPASTHPNSNNATYTMSCGHQVSRQTVDAFMLDRFCRVCGRKYDSRSDYDLTNGGKCCFQCIRWSKKEVQDLLYQCMVCAKLLKKKTQVASNFNDGVILCFACAKDSCLEEERCEIEKQFKKVQEKKQVNNYMDSIIPNYGQVYQKLQHSRKEPNQPTNKNDQPKPQQQPQPQPMQPKQVKKQQQQTYSIIVSQPKQQLKPSKSPIKTGHKHEHKSPRSHHSRDKSPTNPQSKQTQLNQNTNSSGSTSQDKLFKVFEEPKKSLGDFKQVESIIDIQTSEQCAANKPNQASTKSQPLQQSKSTSSSPSSSQHQPNITILQSFPSQKQQLVSPYPKRTIKKHMSIQTFIQKMKIDIQEPSTKIVSCKQCQYDLEQAQAFTIQNSMHQIVYYCRLCYTIVTNKQLLGFNLLPAEVKMDKSRNMRGTSNQRHKIPTNLIYASAGEKDSVFNTPTKPNQNLTNTYNPTQINTMGNTYLAPKAPVTQFSYNLASNTHEKMSAKVRTTDSRNLYKEECSQCKKSGGSLIRTADRGSLCFTCYYARR